MKVVSDAGPLMALAKVGGLEALFRLYPKILTPPAVYHELVTEGLKLGAADAPLLAARYDSRQLEVTDPPGGSLPSPMLLGPGEEQSLLLAIEQQATWLLIDDLAARRSALANLKAAATSTQLKGTLGLILTFREHGLLSAEEAVQLVEAIRERQDIWISPDLCRQVVETLRR